MHKQRRFAAIRRETIHTSSGTLVHLSQGGAGTMRALGQTIIAMLCSFSRTFSKKSRSASIPGETSMMPCRYTEAVIAVPASAEVVAITAMHPVRATGQLHLLQWKQ